MAQTGISGLAVGLTGVGALLVYAGLRGVNPLEALREVSKNEVKGVTNAGFRQALDESRGSGAITVSGDADSGVVDVSYGGSVAGSHPEIADAAMAFKSDTYSQARRSQSGYSDCSSFAAKAMRRTGIDVPDYNTYAFLGWKKLKKISKSQITRGDLLINGAHMAIALDEKMAIGQQREGVNVRTGTHDSIMMYTGPWDAYRYRGAG